MLQNHIGELQIKPKKRNLGDMQDLPLKGRLAITFSIYGSVIFIILACTINQLPLSENTLLIVDIISGLLVLFCIYTFVSKSRYYKYEHIHQQKNYYKWGNVKPTTQKQLEALQLIAFSRYKYKGWTDTLESRPVEVRVKHIPDFRKKLDWFKIRTQEEEILDWIDSWGLTSRKKYEEHYNNLINGSHTPEFLLNYNKYPNWKERLIELTELPEDYFNACFENDGSKPKKLIWAWDLWRAIMLSTAAFECGFIAEDEAWERIYRVSDICHYLFDDLDDFHNNMRLGHAYWCNNQKQAFERKNDVNAFVNAKIGERRLVNDVAWTKIDKAELTENMKDDFASHIDEIENKPTKIGFN
ncbi:DUF1266 domain-containing protein [uncultured Polaribacter sp.]|uniref:DUF1266 domain-containing protein n=1 Tax=uncultured Polaribacter sp. TaxID=174711 RepID=UPI0026318036|nr:DUF1266 domain-containing protein [uncultured Polaribacter sp.]